MESVNMPEQVLDIFENSEMAVGSVSLPYVIKGKVFLSPGTWNGYYYSAEVVKKIYDNTYWNDETTALYLDHNSRSAASWAGEVKNIKFMNGQVIGDVYIVDENTARKLHYGAKMGISPKIKGYCAPGTNQIYNGMFEDFSIVKTPAVKTAYLNAELPNTLDNENVVIILNSEVVLQSTPTDSGGPPQYPWAVGRGPGVTGVSGLTKQEPPFDTTQVASESTEAKAIEWIKKNPSPDDEDVHAFARDIGASTESVEQAFYRIVSSLVNEGFSSGKQVKYDADQIRQGLKVEREHTNNLNLRLKIVRDHLTEDPKYYDHLSQMEKSVKGVKNVENTMSKMTPEEEKAKAGEAKVEEKKEEKPVEELAQNPGLPKAEATAAKKEPYPAPMEEEKEVVEEEAAKKPYPEPAKEEEMSADVLYNLFSNSTFQTFRQNYIAQSPNASMKEVINSFKKDGKVAELAQKMDQKIADLNAKIEQIKTPVERATVKSTEVASSPLNEMYAMAAKNIEYADGLMADFLTRVDRGEIPL